MQTAIILAIIKRLLPVVVGAVGGAAVTYGLVDEATVAAIVELLGGP